MGESSLHNQLSGEAKSHKTYLYNHTATPVLNLKTPVEAFSRRGSSNLTLRTFGSAAFVHKQKEDLAGNLDCRAKRGIYTWQPDMGCTEVSRRRSKR